MSRRRHASVDVWEVTLPHDVDLEDEYFPEGLPYVDYNGCVYTTGTPPPLEDRHL